VRLFVYHFFFELFYLFMMLIGLISMDLGNEKSYETVHVVLVWYYEVHLLVWVFYLEGNHIPAEPIVVHFIGVLKIDQIFHHPKP